MNLPVNTAASHAPAEEAPSERRIVTVMFADMAGFTRLSEHMDPEPLSTLLNAFFTIVVPRIEAHGGTVDKFIGDCVMALFGAPVARGDDPARAVRAALDITEAIHAFRQQNKADIDVHIGINTGLVVCGKFGSNQLESYTVLGETVNIASRLEHLSQPGQILVGHSTYEATQDFFDFRETPDVNVKGIGRKLKVYQVLARRNHEDAGRNRCRLVGRDREREALSQSFQNLQARGGLIDICGPAATGKTTLLESIWDRTQIPGVTALATTCPMNTATGAYATFRTILEDLFTPSGDGLPSASTSASNSMILDSLIAREYPIEAALIRNFLGDDSQETCELLKGLGDGDMGLLFFRALRMLFRAILSRTKLILVVDDFQWIDAGSLKALAHISTLAEDNPLLIVCSRRPENTGEIDQFFRNFHAETGIEPVTMQFGGLSGCEVGEYCRQKLGAPVDDRFRYCLLEHTDGNPFLLERVLDHLLKEDQCILQGGVWRLRPELSAEGLPLTNNVQQLILAQLDGLDQDKKKILRHASVIGRHFLYEILVKIIDQNTPVDKGLDELQRLDILSDDHPGGPKSYLFKSPLTHATVYESLLFSVRRELHNRIGRLIESFPRPGSSPPLGLLAYHFTKAQNWDKARHYLEALGDFTSRFSDDTSAMSLYSSAMELYVEAFGDKLDRVELAKFERKIGEALYRSGEHDQALRHLNSALGHFGITPRSAGLDLNLGIAVAAARLAVRFILQPGLHGRGHGIDERAFSELMRIHEACCWIYFFKDPKRFFYETLYASNLHWHSGDKAALAKRFASLGVIFTILRIPRLASWLLRKSHALAQDIRDSDALALALLSTGMFHEFDCRWEEALECYMRSKDVSKSTGKLREWGSALGMGTNVMFFLGMLEQARELCREIRHNGEDSGDRQIVAWGLTGEGIYLKLTGQHEAAARILAQSTNLLLLVPDYYVCLWGYSHMIDCFIELDRPNDLCECLAKGHGLIVEHDLEGLFRMVFAVKAYKATVWLGQKATDAAGPLPGKKLFRKMRGRCGQFRAVLPELYCTDACRSWRNGRAEAANRLWGKALAASDAIGDHYGRWTVYSEIHRHTGDAGALAKAHEAKVNWRAAGTTIAERVSGMSGAQEALSGRAAQGGRT